MAGAAPDALAEAIRLLSAGEPDDIERAFHLLATAEEGLPRATHPLEWATVQANLALALSGRTSGTRSSNAEEALRRLEQALEVFTEDAWPAQWAQAMVQKGAVHLRQPSGDLAENVERAKTCFESAIPVLERTGPRAMLGGALANLGLAYASRLRGDRAANLEHALALYRASLPFLQDEEHAADRADVLSNTGGAYLERRIGRWEDNVEAAIDAFTRAVAVLALRATPTAWADVQTNMGFAYWRRARGDRRWNLEHAIACFERAQSVLDDESLPQVAHGELGLAYATADLARLTGDEAMARAAIGHAELAAALIRREDAPLEWALAQNALGQLLVEGGAPDDAARQRALSAFERALEVLSEATSPIERRRTLVNVGDLHLSSDEWDDALRAYEGAIHAGEVALAAAYTEDGRREAAAAMSPVYARAASCALRIHDVARSLQLLDRGRTRILTEALAVARAGLDGLPPEIRSRLERARAEVQALEARTTIRGTPSVSSAVDAITRMARASASLMEAIHDAGAHGIRLLPAALSAEAIVGLVPPGGALVAPLVTADGGAALVIPHGEAPAERHVVDLPDLTDAAVSRLLYGDHRIVGWLDAYRRFRAAGTAAATADWEACVRQTTGFLWGALMGPVDASLRALGVRPGAAILLLAPGVVGVLPLHAAWRQVDGTLRPFADDWTTSYSPGAAPLEAVIRRQRRRPPVERALVATSDPAANLPFAGLEVAAIQQHFAPEHRTALGPAEATYANVTAAAAACTHLHFASHGLFHAEDPMASALQLAGGEVLTVAHVFDALALEHTRLTVLSACESGLVDIEGAPDEAIGFPAAFLQAGSTAAVSTLYAVNDASTAILMDRFYALHLDRGVPAPSALGEATRWLRESTASELALSDWWARAAEATGSAEARERADHYRSEPDGKPFEAPHHWAAYIYTGPPD